MEQQLNIEGSESLDSSFNLIESKNKESIEKINSLRREEQASAVYVIGQELTKISEDFARQGIKKGIFYKFVANRFFYSEDTTRKYIKIYLIIPEDFIKKAKNILLGHLYSLVRMNETERNLFIAAMILIENSSYIKTENIKLQKYYSANDISNLKILRERNKSKFDTPEKIRDYIVQEIIVPKVKEDFNNRKPPDEKRGREIKSDYFKCNFYAFEPTTEQGLIGLFCTIFHLIANPGFKFNFGKETMSFSRILNLKTSFPDAKIECVVYDRNGNPTGHFYELHVELEYKSHNYIQHLHQITPKRYCSMIICWENNWNEEKPYVHILSIKELLEKGQIVLHH